MVFLIKKKFIKNQEIQFESTGFDNVVMGKLFLRRKE
jgi:hypothetical protein